MVHKIRIREHKRRLRGRSFKILKLKGGWIRDKSQEEYQVFRWYEHPRREIIASVVEGYFPTELNLRISSEKENIDRIEVRGSKSIMEKRSDEHFINTIESMIEREKIIQRYSKQWIICSKPTTTKHFSTTQKKS